MQPSFSSNPAFAVPGRCGGVEADDVRAIWRAITGRPAGESGWRGGHHRHQHGHGHGDFSGRGPGGFGFGPFPPGGPRGRLRKARRGDIRTAALLLLAEQPRNGYQIMQEVQERSNGVWSPSPGSVYPALQQLEDEGLIRSDEADGRKLLHITDEGRARLGERDTDAPAPWDAMGHGVSGGMFELGKTMREVAFAFSQVMRTGSEGQIDKAREVLASTRRDLYRILADGDLPEAKDASGTTTPSEQED
jgi:DNA-binding PadR family transcriptional regulator